MRTRAARVLGVDERLVMPGSGIEIIEGQVVSVPGADPPHATRHSKLSYLLEAHVAPGFVAAIDMLTRASATSDFAPDASVFPEGPDRETGGRRLEVLAFEVVATQSLGRVTTKARVLCARGVGRIFAIMIEKDGVLEWDRGRTSPKGGRWRPMHRDETIEDAALAIALPVRALLDGATADEAVLAALEARRPDLVARIEARGEARGEANGEARGKALGEARGKALGAADAYREIVESICGMQGIAMTPGRRRFVRTASSDELGRLARALTRGKRWPRSKSRP